MERTSAGFRTVGAPGRRASISYVNFTTMTEDKFLFNPIQEKTNYFITKMLKNLILKNDILSADRN